MSMILCICVWNEFIIKCRNRHIYVLFYLPIHIKSCEFYFTNAVSKVPITTNRNIILLPTGSVSNTDSELNISPICLVILRHYHAVKNYKK